MIDLRTLNAITFDLTLPDGRILNVKQPTKELYDNLTQMKELATASGEVEKGLGIIYSFLTRAFNRNANGITFTKEELEEMMSVSVASHIIVEFQKWTSTALSNLKN